MKLKQFIGLCILLSVYLLIGAVSKDLTTWNDWLIIWGVAIGSLVTVAVGLYLLLNEQATIYIKAGQVIGMSLLLIVFLLIGAVTKDVSDWQTWLISWGIISGGLTSVVVGVYLLLKN